jgi:hypothetical protein
MRTFAFVLGMVVIGLLGGCHEKEEVTPPPPPLRPDSDPAPPTTKAAKDCDGTDPKSELKPMTFDERSIPEGQRLAEKANAELHSASSPEIDRSSREQQVTEAVNDYVTALAADPYNVAATYGLAAAYAKVGRNQCSINLLTRLLQMRPHPSKHAEVEAHIDHLLGRKQALDADFDNMRRDQRFRELIEKMCEGTNDPNCVYGGQKDNRER